MTDTVDKRVRPETYIYFLRFPIVCDLYTNTEGCDKRIVTASVFLLCCLCTEQRLLESERGLGNGYTMYYFRPWYIMLPGSTQLAYYDDKVIRAPISDTIGC